MGEGDKATTYVNEFGEFVSDYEPPMTRSVMAKQVVTDGDMRRERRGGGHATAVVCVETGVRYRSLAEAAEAANCSPSTFKRHMRGKAECEYAGRHWRREGA